jgi:two-component system, OmpR family, phosphate regulon response regulator PhoB
LETGNRIKVIVIDDEPDMQLYLAALLEENGFEPIIAEDEISALEKARRQNPACIILNAMIPTGGGVSMYVTLRCDDELKAVPVIMLSPVGRKILFHYQKMKSTPEGRSLPEPEAYLVNPPDAEELIKEIHKLAKRRPPS